MIKIKSGLFFGVLLLFNFAGYSQNLDVDLLRSINKHSSTFKDRYLEFNASSVTYVSIGAPLVILSGGFITHNKQLQRDGLYMAGSYLLSGGVTSILKKSFKRMRPYEKYDFIIRRDDEAGGYSFPSGHTSAAFNMATSLSLRYHTWKVIVPAYVFAGSVAWARIYQGVHYPSDVLAGALIGSACAYAGYRFQRSLENKKYQQHHDHKAVVSL